MLTPINNNRNPFAPDVDLEFDGEESISGFMRGIEEVNQLKYRFMSIPQILFLPVTVLIDCLPKREVCNPYDVDEEESPYFGVHEERRRPENALLRQLYDLARSRVQYHMMPKTQKIRHIDDVA